MLDRMKFRIGFLAAGLLAASLSAQIILVQPYVQPGDGSTLSSTDVKVVAWMTDQKPGTFTVEFGTTEKYGSTARPQTFTLNLTDKQKYLTYSAELKELPLDADVFYRVSLGGKAIRQSSFHTRKTADKSIRFIVVGDTADGNADSRTVAYQMAQAKPEFMLIVGDIVYSKGLVSEYEKKFWPVYNNLDKAGPTNGAPIMQSVPFYGVLGNHDVGATNLTFHPDGYGAFYFFHPPLNGPTHLASQMPLRGADDLITAFQAAAGPRYPKMQFFSFDNGAAHFLCLDANKYVDPTEPALRKWIADDLARTTARWKFVFFHQPGFNASAKHNSEQAMRLLSPVFEAGGVDVVFAGHVHNYQRSKPLKFAPTVKKAEKGLVAGKFTLDEQFDGQKQTQPNGIIYVVTGGGGAKLYDPEFTGAPEKWKTGGDNFTSTLIADRHSFSLVGLDAAKFTLRQMDDTGKEVDRFVITKPAKQ
jgi:predicted phosphodiesterase